MDVDFLGSCDRMYSSAIILNSNQEYYTSCYLSGYVVECYLKHLILSYGVKEDGSDYTVGDIKSKYVHKIHQLISDLQDYINLSNNIPVSCRIDLNIVCKTICIGTGGHPKWDPKYRYGEHPAWNDKSYSDSYIRELNQLHDALLYLRTGGVI